MVLINLREFMNSSKSFLSSPLYIFLFVNSVVILIWVLSKFHHPRLFFIDEKDGDDLLLHISKPTPAPYHIPNRSNSGIAVDTVSTHQEIDKPDITIQNMMNQEEVFSQEHTEPSSEEADDSLEATWEAITGGNKELKKSETWPRVSPTQSIGSKDLLPSVAETWKDMRKSVTFNDALMLFRRGGLRGDFSVSVQESNKSFDDFIKKINHERLLQRQESDQRALIRNIMLNQER